MRITLITSLGLLVGLGCGGGDEADGGGLIHRDGAVAGEVAVPSAGFTIVDLPECGQAGYQTVAATNGSQVYFATLAETTRKETCALENRAAEAAVYDLCVVSPSATGFTGAIVTSQPYAAKMGVGLALDSAGVPTLAYTGGPSAALRCGASDLLLATVNGATLGAPRTIAAGSASTGMPADQAPNCAAQDVCNRGDATGYWPTLARDPVSGALGVAFRDLHFGFAATDIESSDVEFAKGDGYAVYTVDVARGGGVYARLAFSPTGQAAVVHYVEKPATIWLDRETPAGWTSQKLFVGPIGEQLGFAISGQGLHALAYFDVNRKLLAYKQSPDGDTFTAAEDVDRDGVTGMYPSLAFDAEGNPAIAYYRCSDYGVTGCQAAMDGLYLARRQGGVWTRTKVHATEGVREGLYTALAFVGGKAVIAFQSAYLDPLANTSKVSLHIAKEM